MTPPAAEDLLPRFLLGPALRAQPDRRLVALVRGGYEAAFDEIMRRYGGQLRRYAAAIVGSRAEDVTQEAFSKALQALRRDGRDIELRPWLYRIVRNTALNDIRDRHPATLVLADGIVGHGGVTEEVERREEVGELIERLRALPEPQRAAIVMRELEGLGHEEIGAALGISDGAARQAIHRARTALRNGFGLAIPLPLLKVMLDDSASRSAEVAAGGAGAGIVLKAATATVLVAGTFGAGVALHETGPRHSQGQAVHHRSATGATATKSPPATPTTASRDDSASGPKAHRSAESHGGPPAGVDRSGPSRDDHGSESRGNDSVRSGGTHDPSGHEGPSHEGSSSGGGSSGPGGGSSSGDDGAGGGGSGSSEEGPDSGTTSGSGEVTESNSGPGSSGGDGDALSSGSSGSGDSGSGDVLSGEMQLQPQEGR